MIYLWVRKTADWDDEAEFRRQLAPAFAPRVALWDATFNLPYREFRSELRKIATLNLSRVNGAVSAGWRDIPDGAWVAPVDDDDWFAPELAEQLEPLAGAAGCRWSIHVLQVPIDFGHRLRLLQKELLPRTWRPQWICATNNYALTKSPEHAPLLASHVAASRWLEPHPGRLARLEQPLSLMNRSLASQTSLGFRRRRFARRTLVAKWREYRTLYARPLDPGLAWAAPYVARMAALMDSLQLRGTL